MTIEDEHAIAAAVWSWITHSLTNRGCSSEGLTMTFQTFR